MTYHNDPNQLGNSYSHLHDITVSFVSKGPTETPKGDNMITTTTTPSNDTESDTGGQAGLSTGAIVGIVVGAVVGVVLVTLLVTIVVVLR